MRFMHCTLIHKHKHTLIEYTERKLEKCLDECDGEKNVGAFHVENDFGRTNKIFIFTICCFPIIKNELKALWSDLRSRGRSLASRLLVCIFRYIL